MKRGRTRPLQRPRKSSGMPALVVLFMVVALMGAAIYAKMTDQLPESATAWFEAGEESLVGWLVPASKELPDPTEGVPPSPNPHQGMGYIVKEARPKQSSSKPREETFSKQRKVVTEDPHAKPMPSHILERSEYRLSQYDINRCARKETMQLVTLKYDMNFRMQKISSIGKYPTYTAMKLPAGTVLEIIEPRGRDLVFKYMERYSIVPIAATDFRFK